MKVKAKGKAALAIVVVGLAALSSQLVHAMPDHAHIVTYYSDATMSEVVGMGGNGCQHAFSWGTKTAYYEVEDFACY